MIIHSFDVLHFLKHFNEFIHTFVWNGNINSIKQVTFIRNEQYI